jgi:hypothetical protein
MSARRSAHARHREDRAALPDTTRLVLVEGFPGSGKSTTAQWLTRQWQLAGRSCRWFYEQQHDHPVVGIPAGADYETWEEYFEYRRERWTALTAEAARSDALTVMESALLQYPVFVMLRRGVAPDVIVAFLRSVADIIRPLAPRLVYLATADADTAYRTTIARRGGRALIEKLLPAYETGEAGEFFRARGLHGLDGLVAYWREHNAVCERALGVLDLETLVVDPHDGDWSAPRAAIARFLGLAPAVEPRPSAAELRQWVGRYRVVWNGEVRECTVGVEEGRLVMKGLLWPDNRLLGKGDNVFDAESWPFEVVFESAARGAVGHMSVRGPRCATP